MKKDKRIGELLGIKQDVMALLLKVTRSQWAMYVTGKRSLPTAANLKITEMLTFTSQLNKEGSEPIALVKTQESKMRKYIEDQLINNKYRQSITEAKLNSCKKNFEEGIIAFQLAGFLATKETEKVQNSIVNVIKNDAVNAIEKNSLQLQEQYTIKLRMLQQEELLLKERLSLQ
ncbi:hypothetical protein GON26_17005 [Flavobacterium sp. GA093]|uniref:Uncharacterized protein n=1 Tax=Flavobacterium hydrocarbonoxydans TaxID=2683249 RepID=A0A6I4NYF8_9FLAO|nr:hypothetical protein [Flavobacterium hydrocarbonoxydans]MWB96067.1 hypothetical protein [Flavobacterium hydrocarbonoxydans]